MPQLPLVLWFVVGLLFALFAGFVWGFFIPALRLRKELATILRGLSSNRSSVPRDLAPLFKGNKTLAHLWKEFAETLHSQQVRRAGPEIETVVRSTQPAESYFNSQLAVDGQIRAEFFKHAPGLFTGIGIIGTFGGLIFGLTEFKDGLEGVAGPEQGTAMNSAIAALLREVSSAFIVSASAIGLAMLATLVEKVLLTSLYGQVEQLAQDLDSRFDAGAGEEYLARLVAAAEDSASQAKILKDALVDDLKKVLVEISEHQLNSSQQISADLGNRITTSITDSLADPLAQISNTVRSASGDQSATASRLMQDAMASFSQQLSDLFGGQVRGLAALNTGASENMAHVVTTLERLVGSIEAASTRSSEAMSSQLTDALLRMERHQASAQEQSAAFLAQMRDLTSQSQTETNAKLQETLSALGQQVASLLSDVRNANEASMASTVTRDELMTRRTSAAVSAMSSSVESVVHQMAESSSAVQAAVAEISRVTTSALDRMMMGADTLHSAASHFAEAGQSVSGVVGQTVSLSGQLTQVSGSMRTGADALTSTVADYALHREAVARMVAELAGLVDRARREASLTADVLSRIDASAQRLAEVQHQTDTYLDGVTEVLAKAHEQFADQTLHTLDRVNTEYHKKLSTAVSMLAASIGQLDSVLAGVGTKS